MTVWDAVWLNDEIDLLEWRMRLLRQVVDKVLVVEGDRYFSGAEKGSAFLASSAQLRALGVDVHHVIVSLDGHVENAWDRENQQRKGMIDALRLLASEGDLVLACDVDEIPRPSVVHELSLTLDRPVRLHMTHANYYANWVQETPWTNSAWAFPLGQEIHHKMLRVHFGEPHGDWDGYVEDFVPNAGWHLSFMGGEDAVRRKWAAYSHQENNTPIDQRPGHLERCFRYGVHFTGRGVLKKQVTVEPELLTLRELRADFFRFDKPPPRLAARTVMAWTWLRRKPQVPDFLRRFLDRHDFVLFACAPVLLVGEWTAAKLRKARAPSPWPDQREWLSPG